MEKIHPLALPALILAAIFGGLAPIFGKLALYQFEPYFIITLRFGLALLVLLPIFLKSKAGKLDKKDYPLIFLIGVLGSINVFCFIVGLKYSTSIMSQLVYLLVPLIVLVLSKVFYKEKFYFFQIAGVFLGFAGAVLILGKSLFDYSNQLTSSLGTFKGNLILLFGITGWSLYLIFSKKASKKYSPLALTVYTSLTVLFISIVFILGNLNQHAAALATASPDSLLGVIGLALFNSVGMLFLYQWGTKQSSPFVASLVLYIGPLVTAVIAIPLFGEKITFTLFISTVLIFLSVYLATIHPLLLKRKEK